ncbi:hypothetical protein ILUMI_09128 [Ignelater luminosus]|uniref:RNase H type-1 domain-containing protein n=1 Tax=Ignelater luminosus TaxID=2038154 RepID=A0A8K0D319_IGNLU|nr:hypothetical protein ILUMI_09128 [Ignelater luminosus]
MYGMRFCLRNKIVFSLLNRRIYYNAQQFYNNYNLLTSNKLLFTMSGMNRDSNNVLDLTQRLEKAEKRLKLLKCEIMDIKRQLSSITQNSSAGDTNNTATSVRRSLSELDSSTSNNCKRPRYDFTKEGDYVVVFTDGACENNGKLNAKAGIGVWFGNNHPLNVSEPVTGRATNNTAEIQACVRAVNIAHGSGIKKLKIKTDSQFVINYYSVDVKNKFLGKLR